MPARRRLLVLATAALALTSTPLMAPSRAAASALPLDLSLVYNADCTSERGLFATGDCDGSLFRTTFVADAFPGRTATLGKQPFRFGSSALTDNNTVTPAGQTVRVPAGARFAYAHLILTGVNIAAGRRGGAPMSVTYGDASKVKYPVTASDWADPKAKAFLTLDAQLTPSPVNVIVAGDKRKVFAVTVALDRRKAITSISLPASGNLRLFALTLSNTTMG